MLDTVVLLWKHSDSGEYGLMILLIAVLAAIAGFITYGAYKSTDQAKKEGIGPKHNIGKN
jgi:hypothetical protein